MISIPEAPGTRSSWDHEPEKTEAEALIKMKSSCQMTQENIRYDFGPESTWSTTFYRHIWKSYSNQEFFEPDYRTLSKLYANCWSAESRCWNYRTRGKSERSKLDGITYESGRAFVNENFELKVNARHWHTLDGSTSQINFTDRPFSSFWAAHFVSKLRLLI